MFLSYLCRQIDIPFMVTDTDTYQQPLVSFILTYYNLPVDTLCQCIDSILQLTLRPFEREIIVIDDGSGFSPMNDLMKYGDDIIYVRKKNGGLSTARNQGIEMATGKYIQFVDADDQLIMAPYEQCLDAIRLGQDVEMVLFDFTDKQTVENIVLDDEVIPVSGTEFMRHHNIHGSACGYLFSRNMLGDLRFTPGIYHEDEEFTPLLMLRAEKVYPTKLKAYYYYQRPDSITNNQDQAHVKKRMDDFLGIICRLHEKADLLPIDDQLAMERRVAQLTMDYIHNTIRQFRSLSYTKEKIEQLRQLGLFPLPDNDYTQKYKWFRRLTNSNAGLMLLVRILPLMKKER